MQRLHLLILTTMDKLVVYISPLKFPLTLLGVRHTRLEIHRGATKTRYDIHYFKNHAVKDHTHFFVNYQQPGQWLPFLRKWLGLFLPSKTLWRTSDEDQITAAEEIIASYPRKDKYGRFGPNCNSFVQYVLDGIDADFRTPSMALGRGWHGL